MQVKAYHIPAFHKSPYLGADPKCPQCEGQGEYGVTFRCCDGSGCCCGGSPVARLATCSCYRQPPRITWLRANAPLDEVNF